MVFASIAQAFAFSYRPFVNNSKTGWASRSSGGTLGTSSSRNGGNGE